MDFALYSCGDPQLFGDARRGCGHVERVLTEANVHARECPLCGARRWHYLGRESVGLTVTMPGAMSERLEH